MKDDCYWVVTVPSSALPCLPLQAMLAEEQYYQQDQQLYEDGDGDGSGSIGVGAYQYKVNMEL